MNDADELFSDDITRFAGDRPECLDLLTERERLIFIARHSECEHQRQTLDALSREFGVSPVRIRQIDRVAVGKIRSFREQDFRRCQHCQGRGWL